MASSSSSTFSSSLLKWMDIQVLLVSTIVFLLLVDIMRRRRPKNFPPGPLCWPVIGNTVTIDFKKAHLELCRLAEQYGNIYSLKMSSSWSVVLNGYKMVREALVTQGDTMADRPESALSMEVSNHLGVVTSNGYLWRQQRKFALFTLKSFGVGKKSLESAILDEFTHLSRDIEELDGKTFNPHLPTNYAVANIICSLVFGHRFEYTDKKFQTLMAMFDKTIELEASIWAQLYDAFPMVMKRLPGPHQTIRNIYDHVKVFLREEIEQHKKDWEPSEPRDYIDCYLNEIEKSKENTAAGFTEDNLIMCSLDLFVAGSETTSTTLRWSFLYMAKYPEVQEKVQAEIDRVIGQSRLPTMADRADMPYTDAVIHEIQRIGNIAPLGLPRYTTKDVQLGDYLIPKGTEIIANLTSVMFDKEEWETPHTFNPGHFLNKEGKFVKNPAFIPFSAGKRVCLGESLAKMELFLFFTSFLQRYTFSMPAGVKPVMDFRFGITLAPQPYEICATPRHL
ncbi:cytochrome P450 2J6-like [Alosa sapidissima]|uniref:cytochrome P450 2J6-like n=1 Tax=Alosa sapidissima TaxID=34773 RepID=UPI001C08FDC8|nr:cytochrome P450 2J6-like [Alosa sapidissima]